MNDSPVGTSSDCWMFDRADASWTLQDSCVSPTRSSFAYAANDQYGYLYGGGDMSGNTYNDLWQYSYEDESWTQLKSPCACRGSSMAVVGHDYLYIFGGIIINSDNILTSDLYLVNVTSQDVFQLNVPVPGPAARAFSAMIALSSTLPLVYGGTASPSGACEEPSLGDAWLLVVNESTSVLEWLQLPLGPGSCMASLYMYNHTLFVVEGTPSNNSVSYFNFDTFEWASVVPSSDDESYDSDVYTSSTMVLGQSGLILIRPDDSTPRDTCQLAYLQIEGVSS